MFGIETTWLNMLGPFNGMIFANVIFLSMVAYLMIIKHPKYIVKMLFRFRIWYCGMSKNYTQFGKSTISYIEHGHAIPGKPSILMIHGFGLFKETWMEMMNCLPSQMHAIAMDLPGFGDSKHNGEKVDINGFAETIKQFVDHTGLSKHKFHLVGLSLGGAIVADYAVHYPDDIHSLGLFCTYGVSHPKVTEMNETLKRKDEPALRRMLPQTLKGYNDWIKGFIHKDFYLPDIIKRGLLEMRKEKTSYFMQVMAIVLNQSDILEGCAEKINVPTLVLWGKEDSCLPIDCVERLKPKLKAQLQKIVILENVGHVFTVEEPKKSAEVLVDFLNSVQ